MKFSENPAYAVSDVVGYIKGKSAIHIARTYFGRKRDFTGQHFWAKGYHVSTGAHLKKVGEKDGF